MSYTIVKEFRPQKLGDKWALWFYGHASNVYPKTDEWAPAGTFVTDSEGKIRYKMLFTETELIRLAKEIQRSIESGTIRFRSRNFVDYIIKKLRSEKELEERKKKQEQEILETGDYEYVFEPKVSEARE